ncbi:MAG TPA: 5'/3'-nucleotidase SurE [Ilumatobacteraceae bacterium]|nr:5'/3'-nucleotidase SurE [Ilumatobacteraceae bacterium]
MMSSRFGLRVVLVASVLAAVAGCSNDDSSTTTSDINEVVASTEPTTAATDAPTTVAAPTTEVAPTTEAVVPLQILVTNDDGIAAPGIDALVSAVSAIPDVEVTVVAPAENQSGTSMSLTEGELVSSDATTAGGVEATAVAGFPADSVKWALENLETEFDLVVSGSNSGQNIGDFSALSGTVGAARYAAQQGIPGVAVSQGLVPDGDIVFDNSVAAAIDWIIANRADYESGAVSLTSINSPTCPNGGRGTIEVPLGTFNGRDALMFDCASTLEAPVDDVDAFANGFTAITVLPIQI